MHGLISMPVNQTSNIFFLPQHSPLGGNRESGISNGIKGNYPATQLSCDSDLPTGKKVIPNPAAITVYLVSFEGRFDFFFSFHLLWLFPPTLNTPLILRSWSGVCLVLSLAQKRTASNGTKINQLRSNSSLHKAAILGCHHCSHLLRKDGYTPTFVAQGEAIHNDTRLPIYKCWPGWS